MNKKELEKMREKMRAENPLLTDEQIEDIIAESESGSGDADSPQGSGVPGISDAGKAVTYECKTRCTFNGQYYREGERLTTTGDVPDFFEAVEGA